MKEDLIITDYHYDSLGRIESYSNYVNSASQGFMVVNYNYNGNRVFRSDSSYYFLNAQGYADSVVNLELNTVYKYEYNTRGEPELVKTYYYDRNNGFKLESVVKIQIEGGNMNAEINIKNNNISTYEYYNAVNTLKSFYKNTDFSWRSDHLTRNMYLEKDFSINCFFELNQMGYVTRRIYTYSPSGIDPYIEDFVWEPDPLKK